MFKHLLLTLTFCGLLITNYGQSNNCSSATVVSVTANCSAPITGSTLVGFTQSISGCTGNADDDGWYQFTATSTSHRIIATPDAFSDIVLEVFSGACSGLISLSCQDDFVSTAETATVSGLTIGSIYRFRIFEYGFGGGGFTVCVTTPPIPPSNDNCAGATNLTVNGACVYTTGTTDGATESQVACGGNADDDVWYSFTATNALQNIKVHPTNGMDPVVQIFSGTCASLTS